MKYIAMCRCEDGTMAHTGEQVDKLSAHPDLNDLVQGGVFVDFAGCDDDLVGIAPIFDPTLDPDQFCDFVDLPETPLPLSIACVIRQMRIRRVGISAWAFWWEGRGAKVGYRQNGKLVWSTGESIPIGEYGGM